MLSLAWYPFMNLLREATLGWDKFGRDQWQVKQQAENRSSLTAPVKDWVKQLGDQLEGGGFTVIADEDTPQIKHG